MRHSRWIVAAALTVWAGCGPGALAPWVEGGFPDKDGSGEGTLEGRALHPDGRPASGARVFLLAPDGTRTQGRADAEGHFKVRVGAGPGRLVVNAGEGLGALVPTITYDRGTRDVGDLAVRSIHELPELLTLRNVGFEERVTAQDADLRFPVFTRDRRTLYALREAPSPGEPGTLQSQVVRVDTETGETEVIAEHIGQIVDDSPGYAPALVLLEDRYLCVSTFHHGWVFDLRSGARWEMREHRGRPAHSLQGGAGPLIWSEDGFIYRIHGESSPSPDPAVPWARFFLLRLDPATGQQEKVALSPDVRGADPISTFTLRLHGPGYLVYAANDACGSLSVVAPECTPEDVAEDRNNVQHVHLLDLRTLDHRHVGVLDPARGGRASSVRVALSRRERALYFTTWDALASSAQLWRFDLAQGTATFVRNLVETDRPDPSPGRPLPLESEPAVLVPIFGQPILWDRNWWSWTLVRYGLEDGTAHILPLEPRESPYSQCNPLEGTECTLQELPGGLLRISELRRFSGNASVFIHDLKTDGRVVRRRELTLDADSIIWLNEDSTSLRLITSEDGSTEAFLRSSASAFAHAVVARPKETEVRFRQVTFVSAPQSDLALSPDGAWLYSLARDPISGRVQLFRVMTREE